jgi:signal transduction histidine kinase
MEQPSMNRIPIGLLWCLPLLGLGVFIGLMYALQTWQEEVRLNQQTALAVNAQALASMLADDERFLAFALDGSEAAIYRSEAIDGEIVLDGRLSDWPSQEVRELGLDHLLEIYFPYSTESLGYKLAVGNDEAFLYLHYDVRDDRVVYRKVGGLSVHRNDHIQLSFLDVQKRFHRYAISVYQPGELTVVEVASTGRALREAPEIQGRWMATDDGYHVELRIPRTLLSRRLSTLVADVDDENSRELKFMMGLSNTASAETLGSLVYSPSDFEKALSTMPFGVQVVSASGRTVTTSRYDSTGGQLRVEAPIGAGKSQLGTIAISQTAVPSEHLINLLVSEFDRWSILALLVLAALILLVLWVTQHRLGRMKAAIATLVDSAGGVRGGVSELDFGNDAVGKVFRELKSTTERIGQYNDYLERMASRLNHELRTPISVVKSSLENLQGQDIAPAALVYVDRASQGVQRLTNILNKMAEARRLEESLDETEVVRFNLAEVVSGCVRGYETAYRNTTFNLDIELDDVPITGIPELIAQLLDKLIDNAVEFSRSGEVRIRLHIENDMAMLRVMNEGPNLPQGIGLFESMVSVRDDKDESHLGLGLYIAKVIAGFHGGTIDLDNRSDTQGVIVTLRLPLLRLTSRLR